jgi:hypothetical protein
VRIATENRLPQCKGLWVLWERLTPDLSPGRLMSIPYGDCVRNKREYFLCEVQALPALHTKNILFYLILDSKNRG